MKVKNQKNCKIITFLITCSSIVIVIQHLKKASGVIEFLLMWHSKTKRDHLDDRVKSKIR